MTGLKIDRSQQAWLQRDPVKDKPIYQVSSAQGDWAKDPSLDAERGFDRADGDKQPMVITADFGALTRISEVIFKKFNLEVRNYKKILQKPLLKQK